MGWMFGGRFRSDFETPHYSELHWEIENLQEKLTGWTSVKSHRFRMGKDQWSLELVAYRNLRILFRCDVFNEKEKPLVLWWSSAIVDRNGQWHYVDSGVADVDTKNYGWTTVTEWSGPERDVVLETQKDRLLPDGTITIVVRMTCGYKSDRSNRLNPTRFTYVSTQTDIGDADGLMSGLSSLSRHLKELYIQGRECDVTLKVGEKTFHAHRLILGSRSPVLAAMFLHGMKEAETGVVCIEDCHPEAFDVFLVYLYSGVAENLTGENVVHVYYVADKYDVPSLKVDCVRYMLSNLTKDSICSIQAFASRHGEEGLLESATEFGKNAEGLKILRQGLTCVSGVSVQTDFGDADGLMEGLSSLSRNFKEVYMNGKECDVTFKVSEKTFRAHRVILGSRTPVLAAMFSHSMEEAETGVVYIEDCHPETFDLFLLYVYSGVAENMTCENVDHVYYVADKYDLPVLRENCVRYMLSNLTKDSICSVLALASRHGEQGLLESATEFFAKNAEEVLDTDEWSKFEVENMALAEDLIVRRFEYAS